MAQSPRVLHGYERVILIGISVLGVLYLAQLAWFTWVSLRQKLVDGIYTFELGVRGDLLETITAPTTGTATVAGWTGTDDLLVSSVMVNVSGLSESTTALIVWSHVLSFVMYAVLISSVIYLCVRLLRGKPFARSMTIAAVVVALALIVLGTGSDYLVEVLRNTIQQEILGPVPPEPFSGGTSFSFPAGYLMAGLAVSALALAFRIGDRVTRDTEGLV